MRRETTFTFLLIVFANISMLAQNPYIQRFTVSEGLPSNSIYTVYQDSKKFIWFASDAGIARYDGSRFTYFRKQDGLSSNDIFDIKEDSFGRIWFFNINSSLNYFADNYIHNEKNTPFLDSLKGRDFSRKFYEDADSTIYFYENPQRLVYTLSPDNHVKTFQMPSLILESDLEPLEYEGMSIRNLRKNENGVFSFRTPAGLFKAESLSVKPKYITNSQRFNDILITCDKQEYAIVRPNGIGKFEVKKFDESTDLANVKALPNTGSDYITSILLDNYGILWISTYDKGVFCFKNDSLVYKLDIKNAKTIFQDHEKNIWISSLKEGIYKINPYITQHQHYDNSLFQNGSITAMCKKDSSGMWCTDGSMVYLFENSQMLKLDFQNSEKSFNDILQLNNKVLLIGETSKRIFAIENYRVNLSEKRIIPGRITQSPFPLKKTIYNSVKNELVSFNQFSLYFINTQKLFKDIKDTAFNERIHNAYYNPNNELFITGKRIYSYSNRLFNERKELCEFANKMVLDHLIINGTSELFNIEGDSIFILHENNLFNLTKAFDQSIQFNINHMDYQDSTLYLTSYRNIYVCKNPLRVLEEKQVEVKLININFRSINDVLIVGNKLYIASDDGLTVLPLKDVQNIDEQPPIPYILSIKINDQETQIINNQIKFTGNKRINIAFTGINYSISPVTFSYQLNKEDTTWTYSKTNEVVFQNLSSGNYTFKIRARKTTSAWSDPVEINITVKAPIWQHPLFYVFNSLFIAGIVFLVIIRRKNIQLSHREVENQIILLEQKSLQAMMNPHFIFNSLGSIQNFLLHNKPYEAGIYLSQFARLIRQNLNAIDTSMINLEEEITRMKNYFDLEKLRLEDKFDYSITVNDPIESEDVLIPSMIIQPFAENAIWHGIANLEGKGFISITFRFYTKNSLHIVIEDSGIGFRNAEKFSAKKDSHLNMGMNIVRKRLILLGKKYGIETGVTAVDKSPGSPNPGTRVTIVVPFIFGATGSYLE